MLEPGRVGSRHFPLAGGGGGVQPRRLLRCSTQKRAALAVPCPGQPLVRVELRSPGAPLWASPKGANHSSITFHIASSPAQAGGTSVFTTPCPLRDRREGAAALRDGPAWNSCHPAVNGTLWTSCQVPSGSQCPGGRREKARGLPGLHDKGVGPRPDPSARLGSISHRFPRTALSLPETKRKW